jgi:hypothetical protein
LACPKTASACSVRLSVKKRIPRTAKNQGGQTSTIGYFVRNVRKPDEENSLSERKAQIILGKFLT